MSVLALGMLLCSKFVQDKPNPFEPEIQQMLSKDLANPPKPGGIVFVGSSSIRLWKSLPEDFPNQNVLNRGFGGSQLSDSVYFAKRIVIPYHPKMVVLFAGTNDIAAGKAPETVAKDFDAFVSVVRADLPNVRIAYISMTPAPSRWKLLDKIQTGNSLIRTKCAAGDNMVYIDTFPHTMKPDGSPWPEIFNKDQLHLNKQGYAIWAKVVRPYLPW